MVSVLKNVAIVAVLISGLGTLGLTINAIVPWEWLTNFFVLIRYFANLFAWIWDVQTTFTLLASALSIQVAIWILKGSLTIINYFGNK